MRAKLPLTLAVIGAVFGLSCSSRPRPPARIILIVVDTLRSDHLSCYGGPTATPHIDALAAKGQLFPDALSSFHQTSMSMGALFTGRTPSLESGDDNRTIPWNGRTWCGLARFADPEGERGCIPEALSALGEVLHDAGYWTAGVLTNTLLFRPAGFEQGFDEWVELLDPESRPIGTFGKIKIRRSPSAKDVNAAVERVLRARPHDKFFLYVHYMDVHDYQLWRKPYARMVRWLDRAIGKLLAKLEEQGLLQESVVIFTSDHGERLGEQHLVPGKAGHRGNPSFEEVLHVPLIVSPAWFDDTAPGLRSQDVFALIAEIAGVPTSVEPELEPDELFLTERGWQTYRRGRWKSYRNRKNGALYLTDLQEDPGEKTNLADRHVHVAAAHRQKMAMLARRLAAPKPPPSALTTEDRRRLETLGYLE